ncbi:hypothetical protein RsTz2092_11930 [Deferribacterales bacterium RsTz2092]|nr:hypothetical protein AGMMS49941_10160 [Deferribacterales bacterium]
MKNGFILFVLILLSSVFIYAADDSSGEIERLLQAMKSIPTGSVFIRNGKEYNPKEAVEHLRGKLARAGDRVKTTEDFIERIASRSSISGKDYLIKFPDGTTITTSRFLRGNTK